MVKVDDIDQLRLKYSHEFDFPTLENVALNDCRKSYMYSWFHELSANKNNANPYNFSVSMSLTFKHAVIFTEDNTSQYCEGLKSLSQKDILEKEHQALLSYIHPLEDQVYKFSRLYDLAVGFHVKGSKHITSCKLIMFIGEIPIIIDYADRFADCEDKVHISFLQDNKFTYDTNGLQYNFCTGLPTVVLPYSNVYIVTNKSEHTQLTADTIMVSHTYRRQFGTDSKRPLLFTVGKECFCCKDGSLLQFDLTHMKEVGRDLCSDVLDRDTSSIVGSYLY